MLASADAVSDHLAASSATYPRVQFAPSKLAVSGASSAAKPARDQLDPSAPASESMNLTLPEAHSRLKGASLQTRAQQLLQDIPILEKWQRAQQPSHEVRDAMMKLGTQWNV